MSYPEGKRVQKQAQLLPTKDTLTALKSDVTLESACLELCDNSLDAWKRTSDRHSAGTINISVNEHENQTELIIRDNMGGVPREQASMLFGLGRTAKTEGGGAIGTFGVGAKKSLVNLGVPFRITSRAADESSGWTYRITENWFEREDDWTVPIYDSHELPPGTTEICIEELNYQWDEETADQLRTQLGKAYNLFLSDELQTLRRTNYDLTIVVDDEVVEAESAPEWSYTRFDGLWPRRYENIQITGSDFDSPVTLHITLGLLTKKDTATAGTDIYCQGRKVASALRGNTGGFSSSTDHLGTFNARHERLKVIVELETLGDGRRLPWDTQKSSIDRHNPVMRGTDTSRGVYNWLRRTVQPYFDADADQVARAFVEPYDNDHEQAANDGKPARHEFSNRQRVSSTCRPDTDLKQITAVRQLVDAHAAFSIRSTAQVSDWQVPAYESQLATEVNGAFEDLSRTNARIPNNILKEPFTALGHLNKLARIHLENGIRCPDFLEEWQKPTYNSFFEQHNSGSSLPKSTVPEAIPNTPGEIATADDESAFASNGGPQLYSSQTVSDESANNENAELFLVFSDGSKEERGAKVLDMSRRDLCKRFGLDRNAGDDVVWEHVRHQLNEAFSGE